jgi:chemotaxis protein methyltransferase CheR
MKIPSITREEMTLWSRYIHEISGISLDETKAYLLETRLATLLRESGAGNFLELHSKIKADISQSLRQKVINAITTNETSFFRDTSPFELLQHKLIPDLIDRRTRAGLRPIAIRIWSAACSTGQEAYSVAIVLRELLRDLRSYDIRILGTDISNQAVAQASYGHFSRLELERGLPGSKIDQYFIAEGERWKIRDEIRAMATFRTMNLLTPFSFPVPFDIIFCRNVAIYFNEADKIRLFKNIGKFLAKDGALIIGSTESLSGLCPEFESQRYLRAIFYRLKATA